MWVLVAAIVASSMAFIDSTVVNVALPALQSRFGASVVGVQWVIEAYGLTLAALILVGGSMGDLFGRRRMFLSGIAVFAAASAACGLRGEYPAVNRGPGRAGNWSCVPGSGKPCTHQCFVRRERTRARHRHVVGISRRSRLPSARCWEDG